MFMTWILIKIKWILNTAFRALRAHLTFIYSSFINFFYRGFRRIQIFIRNIFQFLPCINLSWEEVPQKN